MIYAQPGLRHAFCHRWLHVLPKRRRAILVIRFLESSRRQTENRSRRGTPGIAWLHEHEPVFPDIHDRSGFAIPARKWDVDARCEPGWQGQRFRRFDARYYDVQRDGNSSRELVARGWSQERVLRLGTIPEHGSNR